MAWWPIGRQYVAREYLYKGFNGDWAEASCIFAHVGSRPLCIGVSEWDSEYPVWARFGVKSFNIQSVCMNNANYQYPMAWGPSSVNQGCVQNFTRGCAITPDVQYSARKYVVLKIKLPNKEIIHFITTFITSSFGDGQFPIRNADTFRVDQPQFWPKMWPIHLWAATTQNPLLLCTLLYHYILWAPMGAKIKYFISKFSHRTSYRLAAGW